MATPHEIKVQRREDEGKGASRRLRHAGEVPAVVYGGDLKPVSIKLSHNDVWLASQHDWFYSSILDLSLNGDVQKVLLRDLQRHPFRQQILHLDFQRVSDDEKIRTAVPLHFINKETSPAGKAADVVITAELNEITISCLPGDLPESIEVDLATLSVGDIIHLSQIKLPKGVEIPELTQGADHDVAVVVAKHGRVEVAPEATEEAPADVPATKAAKDDE
ncbi:50S ribosomal protein L25/general stress protein Ctc [Luteimonas sp. BDR2-5]|uniref:50S ribosomal protein L25/general stress protein Ctc n=1 Tax=Proluteimonas luteida TaxID=2878685 RepID=UPI001E5D66C5|nr:50S ribosomal protein L25/general stress protein Ctc [Luteimonas sp. BDR2-5]MCD9028962.1 50S ribosomal protein L25/general stress protein Ctc [Luteimonas sp. BDR2-5]